MCVWGGGGIQVCSQNKLNAIGVPMIGKYVSLLCLYIVHAHRGRRRGAEPPPPPPPPHTHTHTHTHF